MRQTGISGERRLYTDELTGPPLKKLKDGASLRDLCKDYVLFTYAPLFLYGGLEHNPVQEWINKHNHKQIVFILPLDKDVFLIDQTPKRIWNKILWLVEKAYWPSLATHIGSLALIDRAKNLMTRVLCQEIPIHDITLSNPVKLNITTFSVDSNKGCLAFVPGTSVIDLPKLTRLPPEAATVRLAKALFNHSEQPYDQIQPFPWETT